MRKDYKEPQLMIIQFELDIVTASEPFVSDDTADFDADWLDNTFGD